MMEVSRHRPVDTLRGYVRRVDLFKEHAGAAFLQMSFRRKRAAPILMGYVVLLPADRNGRAGSRAAREAARIVAG
jgi:hypothetical protein